MKLNKQEIISDLKKIGQLDLSNRDSCQYIEIIRGYLLSLGINIIYGDVSNELFLTIIEREDEQSADEWLGLFTDKYIDELAIWIAYKQSELHIYHYLGDYNKRVAYYETEYDKWIRNEERNAEHLEELKRGL